jgi:hypothetical protein
MTFSVSWHTLLDEADDLPADATLVTPLSHKEFRITDTQEHCVIIEYIDHDRDEQRPLKREQFETLHRRIQDTPDNAFELDRFPPDADPYPAIWSLHPRFEIDEENGVIRETDGPTTSQVIDAEPSGTDDAQRHEPNLQVYSDALLLTDALERHDVADLADQETDVLVNLYTLLSDVQRSANDLRQEIADVLLNRLHHDQPVSGQYGSVQRTMRRNRSLKDEDTVLNALEAAGINRKKVTSVDRDKVDDALDVTDLSTEDVYEIDTTEYVRKAEVDEDIKETRLQGLKDRLAASDEGDEEVQELQEEVEELEDRIKELTSFKSAAAYHTESTAE